MREDLRGEAVEAVAGVELAGQVGDVIGGEDGDVTQLGVGGHGSGDLGGSEVTAEDEELGEGQWIERLEISLGADHTSSENIVCSSAWDSWGIMELVREESLLLREG